MEPDCDFAGNAYGACRRSEGLMDPNEGDVWFENEGSLEPLPVVRERTVVMRAVGLTKIYPAVSGGAGSQGGGRGALELFRGLDLKVHAGEMVAIVGESGAGKSSLLPLLARGVGRGLALERALYWLGEVGLADRAEHRSGELSGGEQQRVSLARALVTEPKILLADEPTGDLDGQTAEAVFALIQGLHEAHGLTSVLVTHSLEFAGRCGRLLRLKGGRLEEGLA